MYLCTFHFRVRTLDYRTPCFIPTNGTRGYRMVFSILVRIVLNNNIIQRISRALFAQVQLNRLSFRDGVSFHSVNPFTCKCVHGYRSILKDARL